MAPVLLKAVLMGMYALELVPGCVALLTLGLDLPGCVAPMGWGTGGLVDGLCVATESADSSSGGIGELGPRDDCVEATGEAFPRTDGVGDSGWIQQSGNRSRGQASALS